MRRNGLLLLLVFASGVLTGPALTGQSLSRKVIQPAKSPKTGLPYSPGILAGDTLYLSGHLGRDPQTSKLVPGGVEAETRQALANLREVLRAAGMDFEDVVSVTTFITDFNDFDAYNKVYREFFPKDPPARATAGVAALNLGAKVEPNSRDLFAPRAPSRQASGIQDRHASASAAGRCACTSPRRRDAVALTRSGSALGFRV